MDRYLLVCLGGAVGSGARYWLSTWVASRLPSAFPFGVLAVNAIGSFAIGLLLALANKTALISPSLRLALTTGLLGGFTTYSAFAYDTFRLLDEGNYRLALFDIVATVAGCLLACFLGAQAGKLLAA